MTKALRTVRNGAKRVKVEHVDIEVEQPRDAKVLVKLEEVLNLEDPLFIKLEENEPIANKPNKPNKPSKLNEPDSMLPNAFNLVDPEDYFVGPPKWYLQYNAVANMRRKFFSPVDSQGCERMPNTIEPGIKENDPRAYRFQLLISLMLSSQTKDEVNFTAMSNLHLGLKQRGFAEGLSLESMLTLTEPEIDVYICKVGFHTRKLTYIHKLCRILVDQFEGDIPKTIEEITTLPGVGPKMGFLLLQSGWKINDGIGVDVHLHRLAQMWGWTSPKAKTPEKTRLELQDWLPRKYWGDVNPLLVGFGQVVCVSNGTNCDVCQLARDKLCPGVNRKLLKGKLSDARILKLSKQRGDLTELIKGVIENEIKDETIEEIKEEIKEEKIKKEIKHEIFD